MAQAKRVLIVGGVAGGASAAARARRLSEEAQIVLLERGKDISFANCGMPYHIGGTISHRDRLLVQTPEAMKRRFGIDVRTQSEAVRIDRPNKRVWVRNLQSGQETAEAYDALILSPGAAPVRPPIGGSDSGRVFTLRSLSDMDAIKRAVDEGKPAHAVIIGGGYIGLEMTEALRQRNVGVTLVELGSQVFGPIDPEMAEPLHRHLQLQGVELLLKTSVTAMEDTGGGLVVTLSDGRRVKYGLAILAIGVRPEAKLAQEAGLKIGVTGGIWVDEHMRTSDPDIYAVGDAVEVTDFVSGSPVLVPLAGPANRQGRIAADNVFGRPSVYHRTQGTAICKVFDLAVGMTGLSEKSLRRLGMPCEKVYVHPASHASYYPGAAPINLKVLFDPVSGRVLGAQAVGTEGVDKRIDVLAVAIRAGMTVMDLENLELSYAPPYGSAKDPINYAGFAASNALRGDVKLCHVPDVLNVRPDQVILDVRTAAEIAAGGIAGAVNIPLDDLRGRLGELPRDKELLVSCQVGLRGYLACRILQQNGFNCRNLSGGYRTYSLAAGMAPGRTAGGQAPGASRLSKTEGQTPATPATSPETGVVPMQDDSSPCEILSKAAGAALAVACEIDATSLQCPGPIQRLGQEIERLTPGQAIAISARDPAFAADVKGWCNSTGHRLAEVAAKNGLYRAVIVKAAPGATADGGKKDKTLVVFSSDLDRVLASFIIANGAAAMGSKVTMFFTFWGLNVLRKDAAVPVAKTLIERMFGWMMPRGARRLTLSKMHMGGMGTAMMKGVMKSKNVQSLPELIDSARRAGVRLVACSMTMDIMGIRREELMDGVELGGVAAYLDTAEHAGVNLFI